MARSFAFCTLFAFVVVANVAEGSRALSRVFINNTPSVVHFNDGDSFRVLEGEFAGRGSRLAGFNTLESFGPTHAWGGWHPFELWVNAKSATYNAREGTWHCFTREETDDDGNVIGPGPAVDTYGRLLLDCPDLAVDQIEKGLAHAMEIDDTSSRPAYLAAQRRAIAGRRGMWAHGVPGFVLTSLHSRSEDPTRDLQYNRMVSTRDGHSEPWSHRDYYPECSWQCADEITADAPRVAAYARRLRGERELQSVLANVSNLHLIEAVDRYARLQRLPEYLDADAAATLEPRLASALESGQLGTSYRQRGACMVYTAFTRRYGRQRAWCLRDRGINPPAAEQTP
ncbi:MAG: hypothetical protein AAF411_19955 [Myxococcota bacterium]